MAKIKVRYLVVKKGAAGALSRYFWEPSPGLRKQGFHTRRIPERWSEFIDPDRLEAAAIAAAQELNRQADGQRKAEAAAPPPAAVPRTVENLVKEYRLSDGYLDLARKTKRDYEQCLTRIIAWAGDCPVRAIDDERIQKLRKGMAKTPTMANAVIRVLRLLLGFGVKRKWIVTNPASKPDLHGTLPSGRIWPRAAVEAFVAGADELGVFSIGTAVMLDEWLGQREGDILRLPRTVYRNGDLIFRQAKTNAGVVLPIDVVPALKTRLAEQLERNDKRKVTSPVIIQSEVTGQPYKADFFRHEFARVRAHVAKTHPEFELDYLLPGRDISDPDCFKIRMVDLQFCHLRHTAITRMGEIGVPEKKIAAVSGHSYNTVDAILERYMIRTRAMAVSAFERRLEAEQGTPAAKKDKADG